MSRSGFAFDTAALDAEIARIAPDLADAPERVRSFLTSVQVMLTGSGLEAARHAEIVARDARGVALLNEQYRRTREELATGSAQKRICLVDSVAG